MIFKNFTTTTSTSSRERRRRPLLGLPLPFRAQLLPDSPLPPLLPRPRRYTTVPPPSKHTRQCSTEPKRPQWTLTHHTADQAQNRSRGQHCPWNLSTTLTRNRSRPPRSHKRPQQHPVSTKNMFKILQLNVCGMCRRAAKVSMQCSLRDITVACFQETHLKHSDTAPRLQGFTAAARQDRHDGYGGTITCIRYDMKGKVLSCESYSSDRVQMCSVLSTD